VLRGGLAAGLGFGVTCWFSFVIVVDFLLALGGVFSNNEGRLQFVDSGFLACL